MRPEAIRLRCLEAACRLAASSFEAVVTADMFFNYVTGTLSADDLIDIAEEAADALDEREEGHFNEH